MQGRNGSGGLSLKGSRRIGGFSGLGRRGLGSACVRSSIHKAETDGPVASLLVGSCSRAVSRDGCFYKERAQVYCRFEIEGLCGVASRSEEGKGALDAGSVLVM